MKGLKRKKKAAPEPELPEPTGRMIDYTHRSWGHNIEFIGSVVDGKAHACCWYMWGVREGDNVLWETAYGTALARVVAAKPFYDPQDMYSIDLVIIERRDHDGHVLTGPPS